VVNQLDLNGVNQNFLATGANTADINKDGVVNQLDLNLVNQDFLNTITPPAGAGPALGTLVPEPASLLSIGLIAASALVRRGRRS